MNWSLKRSLDLGSSGWVWAEPHSSNLDFLVLFLKQTSRLHMVSDCAMLYWFSKKRRRQKEAHGAFPEFRFVFRDYKLEFVERKHKGMSVWDCPLLWIIGQSQRHKEPLRRSLNLWTAGYQYQDVESSTVCGACGCPGVLLHSRLSRGLPLMSEHTRPNRWFLKVMEDDFLHYSPTRTYNRSPSESSPSASTTSHTPHCSQGLAQGYRTQMHYRWAGTRTSLVSALASHSLNSCLVSAVGVFYKVLYRRR